VLDAESGEKVEEAVKKQQRLGSYDRLALQKFDYYKYPAEEFMFSSASVS